MRLCGSTFGVALSLLLSFLSGALLFLYWRASSNVELLRTENIQLRRELLNAHNDKQSGQFKLSLAEGDLEDAARVKNQLEDDNNAKRSELSELRTKFNMTAQELQKLKQDNEQNQLDLSNLRVNKEAMYKELDGAKLELRECEDSKTPTPKVHNNRAVRYMPVSNNGRPVDVLQPDDVVLMETHRVINPYNSARHHQQFASQNQQQLTDTKLGQHAPSYNNVEAPKLIIRDKPQNANPPAIQLNRRNPSLNQEIRHSVHREYMQAIPRSVPHNLPKPQDNQVKPQVNGEEAQKMKPNIDQMQPRAVGRQS